MTTSLDAIITAIAWIGGGPAIAAVVVLGVVLRSLSRPLTERARAQRIRDEAPRREAIRDVLTEMPATDGHGAAGARRIVIDLLDDGASVAELVELCERGTQLSPDDQERADEFRTLACALANNA